MAAVTQHWLQFAGNEERNDHAIVMAAVTWNGFALQHAGPETQNDPGIVLAAVTQCWEALQFA
eukprot:2873284-Amphidinium_carterae.1